MMGIDLKSLTPQLLRGVEALESIAASLKDIAATARAQRQILEGTGHVHQPVPHNGKPLHLVDAPDFADRRTHWPTR